MKRTWVTARAWLRKEIGHDVAVGSAGALVECPVAGRLTRSARVRGVARNLVTANGERKL